MSDEAYTPENCYFVVTWDEVREHVEQDEILGPLDDTTWYELRDHLIEMGVDLAGLWERVSDMACEWAGVKEVTS